MLRCSEQMRCAFCGRDTSDDPRYVELELNGPVGDEAQWLGAHYACLQQLTDTEIVVGAL